MPKLNVVMRIAGKSDVFYITTAIPYVNAAPHLGHALEFVQTDAIARYQKSRGREVFLVTGSDENSLKNVHAAEAKGITPAELCEKNAALFKGLALRLGLSFTAFLRTSNKEKHWPGVQELWSLCDKAGDIYKKKYRGLYCVGCESFYDESELPEGVCPEHRTKPEIVEEENYFFRLSKYQKRLEELIESDELRIIPAGRKKEVLSFIKGGLEDFSISRSVTRAKGWGVPVPNDAAQIQYVWFDALGTYLTGAGYGTNKQLFGRFWPADVHVIGKGILRFHAIYWPAILLSAGLKLPKVVFVHGYITVEGQKMSKSLGNILDPNVLIDRYGTDPLRYCLLNETSTFEDGDFSERVLMEKNNSELVANVGNLVNRTVIFIRNNFEGRVPQCELDGKDYEFLKKQEEKVNEVAMLLEELRLKEALDAVMAFSGSVNKYFQENEPWKVIKSDKRRAAVVLYVLVNQVKDLAILLEPYLPNTSASMFRQLGVEAKKWDDLGKLSLVSGAPIGTPEILFKKLEAKETAALKQKFDGRQAPAQKQVRFSDFDLEVGEIIDIQKHPSADKLYVEKVKLGDGVRQLVSGLVKYYAPGQLLGKKVVILRNLKPAMLRGVESQGMLLAAENKEGLVEVLSPDKSQVGEKITLGEGAKPLPEITVDDFFTVPIKVENQRVVAEGKALATQSEEIKTKDVIDGKVG